MDEPGSQQQPGFLAGFPPTVTKEFERLGRRRRIAAGTTLFLEGDRPEDVLVILAGEVKISVGSLEGREVILDVLEVGALVGELSAIDGQRRSATVTTISAVDVLAVGARVFNDFLDRHPEVLRSLLLEVIQRLRIRVRHQLEFGTGDALGRTCARLTELADRHGEHQDGAVVVQLPVSQSDLASWTGLSREAVVKALRALRQLGWIDNKGPAFVIHDLARVRDRATR
jgi:CRP-like cAMP-binding protein